MRRSRKLSLVFSLAVALAPSLVLAQSPPSAAPAPPKAEAPKAATGGAAPPRAPAAKPKAAAARRAGKPKGRSQAPEAQRPFATFPGFRMLPSGGSRVFVQVHGKVDVAESKAEGRVVYRLKGATAIATNRFPLITAFFATPVTRVQLVDQGDDLDMVIELRSRADPTYRVIETEQGIVVQVDFPAVVPAQAGPAPSEGSRPRAARRTLSQQPESSDEDTGGF